MKTSRKNSLRTAVIAFALICFGITFANAQQRGERKQKERPTYAKLIEEMDANKDGKLAKDELKGRLKENFSKVDANEDGFITEEEFKSTPKMTTGSREQKERPTYAKLIEEMDANKDGKLAKDELKGRLKENFAKVDTNEDGFISEAEFKNAPKRERRGKRSN